MTRVSRRSHFSPVSYNTALSSGQVALGCASGDKAQNAQTWQNGTYLSGNAHTAQCHSGQMYSLVGTGCREFELFN